MINGMKIHSNVPAGLWQRLGRKGPANSKVSSVGFIVGCRAKSKENSSEGHACHARSEGRACHARGATFDHLWRFNGYDKRAPPIFLRFSTRRDPLVGSAAPRLIIHYDSTDATSASLRGTDL